MAPLSDLVVSQTHRDGLSFLEGVLDQSVVMLKTQHKLLRHIGKLGHHLRRGLVDIVLNLYVLL